MFGLLTFIVGIIFVLLVCDAIISTIIGVCKIILGLILIGFGYICDAISFANREIRNLWYHATVEKRRS